MSKEIGGYFELELTKGTHYHASAIALNTARNCLEYILRVRNYTKIYIPFYTCDVILEPIQLLDIHYEFYHIDIALNPIFDKVLAPSEAFLYTNYYGVKGETVDLLANKIGNQLIIDNSQAFFAKALKDIDTFYSARKFLGVADGAYLYINKKLDCDLEIDISSTRMEHLIQRIERKASEGYSSYVKNDRNLSHQPIRKMSKLTSAILASIDYTAIKNRRMQNTAYLHALLEKENQFLFDVITDVYPMAYPFLTNDKLLRKKLINKKIYIATYWENVLGWVKSDVIEHQLVQKLLPLPIDQRYDSEDMNNIKKVIDAN